jgi:predicted transcriptional regulator
MSARRIAALALTGALLAGGTGAAIAAVSKDDRSEAEQAVLDNAAKRLNVTPDQLRDALSQAQDAQLDQAVKDGKLTQKQADAIKADRKAGGHVLGGPGIGGPGFGHGRGGPGFGHGAFGKILGLRGEVMPDLAKALGISDEQLRTQLRAGKSIADIAKAQGKSLDDVRASLKADAKTALDKAVKDGDLTQKQADDLLDHIDEMLAHIGDAGPRLFRGGGPGKPFFRGHGLPAFGAAGPVGDIFGHLADALGISDAQLRTQLRAGKSIAAIAKAQGKSLDDVRASLKADAKTALDKAVKNDDLTQKQADDLLDHVDEALSHLGDAQPKRFHFRGPRGGGPVPLLRPGGFVPGSEDSPALTPAGSVFS